MLAGKNAQASTLRVGASILAYCAIALADFPNHLHPGPVVGEFLATVETNHIVTSLADWLPIGVAA
ncbi:MAG TPA: hypothetical protein VM912_14335 [Terriglobales bacterium]|nr:hypothetical protein [Terriglobales bacterium]